MRVGRGVCASARSLTTLCDRVLYGRGAVHAGCRTHALWSAVEREDAIRAQMEIDRARLIAERPHVDDREENGTPLLGAHPAGREPRARGRAGRALAARAPQVDRRRGARAAHGGPQKRRAASASAPAPRTRLTLGRRPHRAPGADRARDGPRGPARAADEDRRPAGPLPAPTRPPRRVVAALRTRPRLLTEHGADRATAA